MSPKPALTADQAGRLLSIPDPHTMLGKRDRAFLAVVVGCGLRREELVHLEMRHLRRRQKRLVLLHLSGNGQADEPSLFPSG